MSAADDRWNPDDGPPPTDEERAEAARLTEALARPAAPDDPDLRELVATARRVHATAHPDRDDQRARVERVTREVLAAARPMASPVRRIVRRAWPLAVAAAALIVVGVSVGRTPRGAATATDATSISRDVDDVLRSPVQSGAASAPSTRVYEARLAAWREAYLRGAAR